MSEATASPGIETPANKDDWTAMNSQTGADTLPHADAVQPAQIFEQFSGEDRTTSEPQGFDMIMDIPVALTVELGRTKIPIRNLLQLAHGSIVELDGLAGEPMDILINGTLIAQGEVVVVNEKFGIRLTDIITPQERIRKLNR
ncbi:MAG: flagellar motor switch protein FliN [Rugosibacter sp.]|nr:MAG: flagellar motor switch protein FliN [Rugosibacter sp.]